MTIHRPPDTDGARTLARTALGDATLDVRPVDDDETHLSWWAGPRHVLRLAPDRPGTARLRRELRLRDLVRPHVGALVPLSAAVGEWSDGLGFTVDARLPGPSVDEQPLSAAGEADLAQLLAGLRSVPASRAASLGVPVTVPRSLAKLRNNAAQAARRLAAAGEFDPARLTRLTPHALQQLAPPAAGALVHGGLTGAHLGAGHDGRLRGVRGWSCATIGDPAEDIASLARCVGAPVAVGAATLAGYEARACLRGLWLGRCDSLIRLAERLHTADKGPALRAGRRRAWEPILLERLTELPDIS